MKRNKDKMVYTVDMSSDISKELTVLVGTCPKCGKAVINHTSANVCKFCGARLQWSGAEEKQMRRCIDEYRGFYTGDIVVHFKRELIGDESIQVEPNLYMYEILGTVLSAESMDELVIYKALYSGNAIYARPKYEFLDVVDKNKYPEVKQRYRYEKVEV